METNKLRRRVYRILSAWYLAIYPPKQYRSIFEYYSQYYLLLKPETLKLNVKIQICGILAVIGYLVSMLAFDISLPQNFKQFVCNRKDIKDKEWKKFEIFLKTSLAFSFIASLIMAYKHVYCKAHKLIKAIVFYTVENDRTHSLWPEYELIRKKRKFVTRVIKINNFNVDSIKIRIDYFFLFMIVMHGKIFSIRFGFLFSVLFFL